MKTTPMLLSPAMARAWAEGRKCRTQRVIKLPDHYVNAIYWSQHGDCNDGSPTWLAENIDSGQFEPEECWDSTRIKCPYGAAGDRLQLLTTWAVPKQYDALKPTQLPRYIASADAVWTYFDSPEKPDWCGKLRPGRFMPKWLREFMPQPKILNIRAQHLQDITEDEARDEGIRQVTKDGKLMKYCVYDFGDYSSTPWQHMPRNPIDAFCNLWDSINGKKYSWKSDPWVWDIKFEGPNLN